MSATDEIETKPVYIFHLSRANREEMVYGRIMEEGKLHYKVLLDYPWQEGNRVRTILKSDLTGKPVIELRSEREARLAKGWAEFFEARGEVNVGTLENPKPVPKQALEFAHRARAMAEEAREKWIANFPRVQVVTDLGNPNPSYVLESQGKNKGRSRPLAAGVIALVAATASILLLRPIMRKTL